MERRNYSHWVEEISTRMDVVLDTDTPSFKARILRQSIASRVDVGLSSDYLIGLRTGGSSDVTRFDGKRRTGRRTGVGTVVISGGEHEHGWLIPEPTEVMHIYVNRAALCAMAEEDLDVDGRALSIEPVWDRQDAFVHQMAMTARQAMRMPGPVDRLFLDQVDAMLRAHVLRRYSNIAAAAACARPSYSGADPRMRRVIDYIEANLAHRLGLFELAGIAAMSSSTLARSMRRATGLSVAGYVRGRRLSRAADLIGAGALSLAEVAHETGFSDHSHLTRHFKRHFDVTPSEWRARSGHM